MRGPQPSALYLELLREYLHFLVPLPGDIPRLESVCAGLTYVFLIGRSITHPHAHQDMHAQQQQQRTGLYSPRPAEYKTYNDDARLSATFLAILTGTGSIYVAFLLPLYNSSPSYASEFNMNQNSYESLPMFTEADAGAGPRVDQIRSVLEL